MVALAGSLVDCGSARPGRLSAVLNLKIASQSSSYRLTYVSDSCYAPCGTRIGIGDQSPSPTRQHSFKQCIELTIMLIRDMGRGNGWIRYTWLHPRLRWSVKTIGAIMRTETQWYI